MRCDYGFCHLSTDHGVFGLAEIDVDGDGVADGDKYSRSIDSDDSDNSAALSLDSSRSYDDQPEVLNMWKVLLWKGKFIQMEGEDVEEERDLNIDKKFCNNDTLKGNKDEVVIVTMQLDKDKLLIWVGNVSYGIINTDKAMNKNNVRPFV